MPITPTVANYVNGLYVTLYGRAADSAGQTFWYNQVGVTSANVAETRLITPAQEQQLAKDFVKTQSTFFDANYGNKSTTDFILTLYAQLGGPSQQGIDVNYWTGKLASFGGDRALLAAQFVDEFLNYAGTDPGGLARQNTFNNKILVSKTYAANTAKILIPETATETNAAFVATRNVISGITDDLATVTAASNQIAAAVSSNDLSKITNSTNVGTNLVLTEFTDTLSGTTFNAPVIVTQVGAAVQSLQTVDKITGTGANDTLNAQLNSATNVKPQLIGVENVNITTTAASNLDFGSATGLKAVGFTGNVAAATFSALNLQNIVDVSVSSLEPTAATSALFQFAPTVLAATNDVLKVNLTANGTSTAAGGNINIAGLGTGVAETLDVKVTGTNRITSLSSDVNAGTGATTATNGATTYKFSGDGSIRIATQLTNATTIDGSGLTAGAMRVVADAAKDVTVTGGKGGDHVTFGAGLTNADKYDGGDGRDTLSVSAGTGLSDGNGIKNVEILDVTGAAAFTFDNDKVTSIDAFSHNSAGAMVYQNVVGANAADATKGLTILNNGAIDFGIKGAAALGANSDTLSIVIGSATGQGATSSALQNPAANTGALTFNNIEFLNFDVKADAANVTASGTGAITDNQVVNVTLKGGFAGQAFALSAGGAFGAQPLTGIDASTFAGNLTVSGNQFSQVIKGGTGNDTIATGGRQAFADTVASDVLTGGTGQDRFVFATSDAALTGANLTTAAASTADGLSELTAITDLNLGGSTANSFVDRIDLSTVGGANTANTLGSNTNAVVVVNGGAITPMTGTNLGTAVNGLVNGGVLAGPGAANTVTVGLFSFGGETYLIASEGSTNNDNFGAVASADLIIRVTGVTGTLSVDDFLPF